MVTHRMLVVTEVFDYGNNSDDLEDARVTVSEAGEVTIQPHDSDEPVTLRFTSDEWSQLVEFVRWMHQGPTMGGRE